MDTDTDTLEPLQPAPPQGVKRFFQFNLRSLFWAITFWSVLVVVFTRLGLVEALEAVLALTALLVLTTWFHREFSVARRRLPALLTVLHVLATLLAVVIALALCRSARTAALRSHQARQGLIPLGQIQRGAGARSCA